MHYHNCYVNIDQTDIESVITGMSGENISGKGPLVKKFEDELSGFFQSPYALTCSNGTAGIQMVLLMEQIKEGDEVILPPTAPVMCILPIIAVGARPVFVDTEEDNFNISMKDLDRRITTRTRMLINVPMWGYANNIDEIMEYCGQRGIKVLEDNSHCHGTKLGDKYLGTFGDYAVFSTHERKLITTGEGGFILVKDLDDYEKLLEIRSFGEVQRVRDGASMKGNYGHFFGLNFKLSSINAALGITQLQKINAKIGRRIVNAAIVRAGMKEIFPSISEIQTREGSLSNYYAMVFLSERNFKHAFEAYLMSEQIVSDPLRYKYCPLYRFPLFKQYATVCPNAEVLIDTVFTLPVHEGLLESDLGKLLDIMAKFRYD